ncbi:hypothetical protein [Nocardia asiatica]|uniref:hypothetical protein n=1 Tax=Nocardia asiatica TaxID=209252 RepID=UPI0002E831F8|nr:hypothetical protein [Nocardia asiatica]
MVTIPRHDLANVRLIREATRILVVGCPGSGKSTLAGRLGELRDLPVYALDDLYFGPSWSEPSVQDWREQVLALCARESWIVDGNHASTLQDRLPRANAVIVIDRHPVLCLTGYLRRLLRYRRTATEDLPHYMRSLDGGRQTADKPLSFAWFILRFRARVLPGMVTAIESSSVPVVRLRDRSASRQMLRLLAESETAACDTRAANGPVGTVRPQPNASDCSR